MGHDLPPALVPQLAKMMGKHLKKAEKRWKKKLEKERLRAMEEAAAGTSENSPAANNPAEDNAAQSTTPLPPAAEVIELRAGRS